MAHKDSNEISAANFPALRSFLRGYLHEDMVDEYGSAEEAAETFCEDADTDERLAVAREWSRFVELTHGRSAADISRVLVSRLGGAIAMDEQELDQVSAVFARYLKPRTRRHELSEEEG